MENQAEQINKEMNEINDELERVKALIFASAKP
jgi:hypothetical protein